MALSVSGFPEAARPSGSSTFNSEADSGSQDGAGRATAMSSPRLRSLFGGVGGNGVGSSSFAAAPVEGRVEASSSMAATGYSYDGDGVVTRSVTAPSSPASAVGILSFSSSLEPLSHQTYDFESPLARGSPTPTGKRVHPLPSLPRRTTASPVRLGPSLTRLDIGAATSRTPTMPIPNKLPPPSVVIQEWAPNASPAIVKPEPRSLPTIPSPDEKTGSVLPMKPPAGSPKHGNEFHMQVSAVDGPSQSPETHLKPKTTSSAPSTPTAFQIAESSATETLFKNHSSRSEPLTLTAVMTFSPQSTRVMNAVASNARHVNAVAGPSQPREAYLSTKPSTSPGSQSSSNPAPTSKVLITQSQPRRSHAQSLSMRYQPLVAADQPPKSSTVDSMSSDGRASNILRPLPRIPPKAPHSLHTSSTSIILPTFTTSSRPSVSVGSNIKRPQTTTGILIGASTARSASVHASGLSRSPFDNATPYWASRQPDINALPISSPTTAPRTRSQSRGPRRDRSMDSYYPTTSPVGSRMPSPAGGRHSRTNSRTGPPRTLPSPTIPNVRPVRHAATVDYLPPTPAISGTLAMQMHVADVPSEAGPDDAWSRSLTRSQPPSPRTAPPKLRTKPIPPAPPPPMSWIVTSHSQPQPGAQKTPLSPTPITAGTLASTARSPDTTPPTSAGSALHDEREDAYSVDAYSVDAPLHSHPLEPFSDTDSLAAPPMTPIDVFVDDMDASMLSRSPSPIRYARPDSRGHLSSDDEGLGGGGGSTASDEEGDDERASPGLRRRRRQLRSYRKSYRPREGGEPPHIPYLRRSPSPVAAAPRAEKEREKEKSETKKKRSYFGDYIGSVPTTRSSSPERMSRSRQPRKLASAVSLALEEARSKGVQDASASPKRGRLLVLEDEVLDIKRASPLRPDADDAPGPDTGSSQTSSARSSAKFGWVKAMARKRSEVFDDGERSTQPHAPSRLSSTGAAPVEVAGTETPYMWISATRDTPGAPLFPPPPPLRANHRPTTSVDLDDHRTSAHAWSAYRAADGDLEAYGPACFPSAPPTRTPASSISVSSSAFAALGIISRNRKAPKHGTGDSGHPRGADEGSDGAQHDVRSGGVGVKETTSWFGGISQD